MGVRPGIAGNDLNDDEFTATGVRPEIAERVRDGNGRLPRNYRKKSSISKVGGDHQDAKWRGGGPADPENSDLGPSNAHSALAQTRHRTRPGRTRRPRKRKSSSRHRNGVRTPLQHRTEIENSRETERLGNSANVPPTQSARKGTNPRAENGTRTMPGL